MRNLSFRLFLLVGCFVFINHLSGQEAQVSGKVIDSYSGDALIGATVLYDSGKGAVTDIDGNFYFDLPYGEYELVISYVGYLTKREKISVSDSQSKINLSIGLEVETLSEIEIFADKAISRKTPVAFTNVSLELIRDQIASQELPMVLNSTPGVQATQQGGGDGDARVTIRGFKQRDLAVMIDGIPVNDMENGWVFWSNWLIDGDIQVQRGLGASKIAIPSVGGTINVISPGIGQERKTQFSQEVGNNGFLRSTLIHNSGMSKNGWGYSLAGSYKRRNGWVQGLDSEAYYYYFKVQKNFNKHILTISGTGAPQEHGQRSQKENMAIYDLSYALENGVDTSLLNNFTSENGINYNAHFNNLETYSLDDTNNKLNQSVNGYSDRRNQYHKPQAYVRDSWRINNRMSLSSIAYFSIGRGGGTRLNGFTTRNYVNDLPNFQELYDINTGLDFNVFVGPNIDTEIHPTEHFAVDDTFIRRSVNNHDWYGALSKFAWSIKEDLDFSAGLDYRRYRGEHYAEVDDLLGADYLKTSPNDLNPNSNQRISRVGDKIGYHNDSFVRWFGSYAQLEWDKKDWSAFINVSGAASQYKRVDYFLPKILDLGDTIISPQYRFIGSQVIPDSVFYNGVLYTPESEGLEFQKKDWFTRYGGTFKVGFNYNFSDRLNGFVNAGYLSRNPYFNNIFDFGNTLLTDIENSKVQALEMGWSFRSKKFSSNINSYYTYWQSRPLPGGLSIPDPEDPLRRLSLNVNGMNARHIGVEWDFIYKPIDKVSVQGVVSLGDWIWDSKKTVQFTRPNGQPVLNADGTRYELTFDAEGIKVGDAAQSQFGSNIRYEFIKNASITAAYVHFSNYYSDFDPSTLRGSNEGRQSWKIPDYGTLNLHLNYRFEFFDYRARFNFNVLNALNTTYVSDAENNARFARTINDTLDSFDATSAGVFFGQGRRFNTSITITF
ncbi:MAG: TonB-dependent receptor [Bacteroidota bacterium]